MILDITLMAKEAAPALLSANLRGWLAACVCAAVAWVLVVVDAWERWKH